MATPSSDTHPAVFDVPPAGTYTLDPARSGITFRTRHAFGLGKVQGQFAVRSGRIEVAGPDGRATVTAEVDAASFSTGTAPRDQMVRSARYLHVDEHPLITFTAEADLRDAGTVPGTLTVRGATAPVQLELLASSHTAGTAEADLRTRIDRREFGITAQPGMTGRYLDMTITVVAHA
jgi:polyisoprenoid-binding protein YceI